MGQHHSIARWVAELEASADEAGSWPGCSCLRGPGLGRPLPGSPQTVVGEGWRGERTQLLGWEG